MRQLELIWSLSTAAWPIRRHSRDGREIQIFARNTDEVDGNTDIWHKYWQVDRNTNILQKCWQGWQRYRYLTEIPTKLMEIQIFNRNAVKVDGNTDIWHKYWQIWRIYRYLTKILTKLTIIQIFDRNSDSVDGNTDIWQKRWQSWWKCSYLSKTNYLKIASKVRFTFQCWFLWQDTLFSTAGALVVITM